MPKSRMMREHVTKGKKVGPIRFLVIRWQGTLLGTLLAHRAIRDLRKVAIRGQGLLMPDQHIRTRTAGDGHYRIKHLPITKARTEEIESSYLRP